MIWIINTAESLLSRRLPLEKPLQKKKKTLPDALHTRRRSGCRQKRSFLFEPVSRPGKRITFWEEPRGGNKGGGGLMEKWAGKRWKASALAGKKNRAVWVEGAQSGRKSIWNVSVAALSFHYLYWSTGCVCLSLCVCMCVNLDGGRWADGWMCVLFDGSFDFFSGFFNEWILGDWDIRSWFYCVLFDSWVWFKIWFFSCCSN